MSGPVPSPSMKGMMGRSGTLSLPCEMEIACPPAGGVTSLKLGMLFLENLAKKRFRARSMGGGKLSVAQGDVNRAAAGCGLHKKPWIVLDLGNFVCYCPPFDS